MQNKTKIKDKSFHKKIDNHKNWLKSIECIPCEPMNKLKTEPSIRHYLKPNSPITSLLSSIEET